MRCFLIALVVLCGCSGRPKTYPVSGKVEFETGTAVAVGVVELKSERYGLNARGNIAQDGTFRLTTFSENDGAVAGEHKCVVLQMVIGENIPGFKPSAAGVVAPRYASYSTSGLSVTIEDKQTNEILLKVRGVAEQPKNGEHSH